ncbi:poly-gamma-glutamate system protein [Fusobacterium sp.]|uniref:poly-gamma-glutamate system protein n=1 Tax=Fusobacterium sp. TaxID=68766 RepID=UPI002626F035|nr:poly-gamma-glutamate system protein [Fusobacterium sp.]
MKKKKDEYILVICAIFLIFIQYGMKNNKIKIRDEYYKEMVLSAENFKRLTNEIKLEKIRRKIKIEEEIDKNLTGLMGKEWSNISTTLGNEEAKRTSINPDFSALITKKLKNLNLKEGDVVAVNMSSSFPALNLALISSLDTLKLKGIIVNTVGSSNYGGNIEEFDYLDMENYLYQKGLIKNKSIAYSFGGIDDIGKEFEISLKEKIKEKNKKYNLKFFYNENVEKNIDERYEFYKKYGEQKIKAFVNIGGNILSLGKTSNIIINKDVILNRTENKEIKTGLISKFFSNEIPILYLLNIREIALRNGIPIDPVPFPEIGTSLVYFEKISNFSYNLGIILIVLLYLIKNILLKKYFLENK